MFMLVERCAGFDGSTYALAVSGLVRMNEERFEMRYLLVYMVIGITYLRARSRSNKPIIYGAIDHSSLTRALDIYPV